MIYDKIKNIDLYKGLYPNLDIAIDYIKKGEYVNLPLGKQDIVGKDVWVNVIEIEGKDVATTPFEIHKKYLDIHVDITGNELIETGGEGVDAIVALASGVLLWVATVRRKMLTRPWAIVMLVGYAAYFVYLLSLQQ